MVEEIRTFMLLLAGGFFVSSLYDLYRRFWLIKHQRSWKRHFGDILFALFSSALIVVLLFYSNWGELRSYVFLGLGIGIFTYFKVINVIIN